ncbi:MAG: hypothetical protein HY543_05195 [Deltaproteobacteria bacterium]|nr:hypothetical protein [Deltaproteobacteria bacterium]
MADKIAMHYFRLRHSLIAAALLLAPLPVQAQGAPSGASAGDYQLRLAQYLQAHRAYEEEASAYWDQVVEKRRGRNAKRRANIAIQADDYVLTQPPIYSGPPRPVDPNAPPGPPPGEKPPIPVLADFLQAASQQFGFVPDRPQSELDFKRVYAQVAAAAGLTRDQVVGVYAFETGGNGTYDMQAGVSPTRPRAISPAVGYNQLLSTNSVSLVAAHGGRLLGTLRQKAKTLTGETKIAMERKIEALKRMIAFSRSVPQNWNEFDRLAKSTAGGLGIHAAILDRDIGPLLQVQKLVNSVRFARAKHYDRPLTAAELELMNLTGDGNGIDMVTMPPDLRARVPTSNFFQQSGYERNPVARRTGVVAGLIADIESKMRNASQAPGARDLAAAF